MNDLKKSIFFFKMLRDKGMVVEVRDYKNNLLTLDSPEIYTECISITLFDMLDKPHVTFDYLSGEFYRKSGMDSTGGYYDEIDGRKYC